MLNRRFRVRVVGAMLALVVCAAPAHAQRPRPDRPYRGLFGGNGGDPNSTQQLDLNLSLFGAYDQNILADTGQIGIDPRFQRSGNVDNGTLSLDYTRRAGRATVDFTGGTSYRYYPSSGEMSGSSWFMSGGLSTKLSPRTDFKATESASYLPFYSLGAVPGLTPGSPGEVAADPHRLPAGPGLGRFDILVGLARAPFVAAHVVLGRLPGAVHQIPGVGPGL